MEVEQNSLSSGSQRPQSFEMYKPIYYPFVKYVEYIFSPGSLSILSEQYCSFRSSLIIIKKLWKSYNSTLTVIIQNYPTMTNEVSTQGHK